MNEQNCSRYFTRLFNRALLRLMTFVLRMSPMETKDLLGLHDC